MRNELRIPDLHLVQNRVDNIGKETIRGVIFFRLGGTLFYELGKGSIIRHPEKPIPLAPF